ncbi:MAG: hypothetical protein IT564_05520, partial [Rhodospirillales bacterium]|nr:hypothetical protein [Rhodospirillales bacterium]
MSTSGSPSVGLPAGNLVRAWAGDVLSVTLNRPDHGNALDAGMDIAAARSAAVHTIRRTYRTQRQAGVPME